MSESIQGYRDVRPIKRNNSDTSEADYRADDPDRRTVADCVATILVVWKPNTTGPQTLPVSSMAHGRTPH